MSHAAAHDHAHHGDHAGHQAHHHHISSVFSLRLILGILILFTVLTVGAANLEQWVATTFHVDLPLWINVFIALSIAVVKCTLVLLYFMHLRHDNPVNSLIFFVCLLAFFTFLGFTMLDVGNRDWLDTAKSPQITAGGTGVATDPNFINAVQKRWDELEAARLPATVAALAPAIKADLAAKGSPDIEKTMAEQKISRERAIDVLGDKLALAKAKEKVAPEVREAMLHDFEHHMEHYRKPAEPVLKKLTELLGVEKVADILREAAERDGSAFIPDSTASHARPHVGLTENLFDAAKKPEGHTSEGGAGAKSESKPQATSEAKPAH